MTTNLREILEGNKDIISNFSDIKSVDAEIVAQNRKTINFISSLNSILPENVNLNNSSLLLEIISGGESFYYKADISKGSYEAGDIEFSVVKLDKSNFDKLASSNLSAKMTYNKDSHEFSIKLKDADGNEVSFKQGKLDATTLDHIKQGLDTIFGGTYDMKGNMKDSNGKDWKIEFGTDSNYNVEYMKLKLNQNKR